MSDKEKDIEICNSFDFLRSEYKRELSLLVMLCQLPGGVFLSDIESMGLHRPLGDWKAFLSAIVDSSEVENEKDSSQSKTPHSMENFWLVRNRLIAEVGEKHYKPYKKVYGYVNGSGVSEKERDEAKKAVLKHLARSARRLLRSLIQTYNVQLELTDMSAARDVGMWSETGNFTSAEAYNEGYLEQNLLNKPKLRFT